MMMVARVIFRTFIKDYLLCLRKACVTIVNVKQVLKEQDTIGKNFRGSPSNTTLYKLFNLVH